MPVPAKPPISSRGTTQGGSDKRAARQIRPWLQRGLRTADRPRFPPHRHRSLIIMTGMPNSGKTDFLNDLTSRIMRDTERFVCYLSFEVPDKDKHIAHLVHLLLGKANTTAYTDEQLTPILIF